MGNSKNVFISYFINSAAFLTAILILLSSAYAGEVNYIYDDLGRLVKVIDDQGNESVYTYDAVGNLLSITGNSITGAVAIIDIEPWEGSEGTVVTIYGKGFSSVPSENIVSFNGVSAVITSSTSSAITTSVPAGATTGRVVVQTPLGLAMSAKDFNVLQPVTVEVRPSLAFLKSGKSQQFTALVTGTSDTSVTWSVEGIEGGASTIGTITADGLYNSPSNTDRLSIITITARSNADNSKDAKANVYFNVEKAVSNNVSVVFQKIQTINYNSIPSTSVSVSFQKTETINYSSIPLSSVSVGFESNKTANYGPVLSQPISTIIGQ